jgi:hypothetical protein
MIMPTNNIFYIYKRDENSEHVFLFWKFKNLF